jgi:hypothetical protein
MKRILLLILNIFLITTFLFGCGNPYKKQNENLHSEEKSVIHSINIEPTTPKWSLDQITGADMADIDYASKDIVIFHGYFGLFVYDLNNSKIIRSLDLKSINCSATQGDSYCEVEISNDGNTVQLHEMNNKKMYVYSVPDNTLHEMNYSQMKDSFESHLVDIKEAMGKRNGALSHYAVKLESGEYGYLIGDGTLGTLEYVCGDKRYSLFKSS